MTDKELDAVVAAHISRDGTALYIDLAGIIRTLGLPDDDPDMIARFIRTLRDNTNGAEIMFLEETTSRRMN